MDNKLQNVSQIQNTASSSSRHLKNGDTVRVRIISDKGGGNYEGTVAGAKIKLHSNAKLVPGSSFPASVSVKNGRLSLIQTNLSGINLMPADFSKIEFDFDENPLQNLSPKLLNLLQVLGLPADSFGVHIMKTIRQLNISFDNPVIRKILQKASRNHLNKKSRADIMLLLSQKNLSALSDDEIDMLASLLDGDFDNDNGNSKNSYDDLNLLSCDSCDLAQLRSLLKEYFVSLFNNPVSFNNPAITEKSISSDNEKKEGENPSHKNFQEASPSLALLNQTFSEPATGALGNWICVPFEIVTGKDAQKTEKGFGCVRFYITQNEKLKYVCLNCKLKQKKFSFSLKFDKNKCTDIKFNVSDINAANDDANYSAANDGDIDDFSQNESAGKSSSEIKRLVNGFRGIFNRMHGDSQVNIEWKDSSFFEGLFCDDDKIVFLDGLV